MCCGLACPGGCYPPASLAAQPGHLLAAAARLATRRRVGAAAPPAAGLARRRRPGRLVTGVHRLGQRASPAWGELTGANPVDRAKLGSKYHLLIDAAGIPLRSVYRPPTPTTPSCWSSWSTPSLRSSGCGDALAVPAGAQPNSTPTKATTTRVSKGAAPPRDHPADRPPWDRIQPPARSPPVDGRTLASLVAGQPAAHRPLRAPRRHPHRVSASGLRPDLHSEAPTVVKPPLSITSDLRHLVLNETPPRERRWWTRLNETSC
jgi:hypothetical protein